MTSAMYWERQVVQGLHREGVERVAIVKSMPHPAHREIGTLYIRPAKAGYWAKSRMERHTPRWSAVTARVVAGLTADAPWCVVREKLIKMGQIVP